MQWNCTVIAELGARGELSTMQNCSGHTGKIKHVVPRVKGKITVAFDLRDSADLVEKSHFENPQPVSTIEHLD